MFDNKDKILKEANKICKNTLMETLNIEIVDIEEDYLISRMPVNSRVYQPDGVLHGGATAALAESVGSFAAHILLDKKDGQSFELLLLNLGFKRRISTFNNSRTKSLYPCPCA